MCLSYEGFENEESVKLSEGFNNKIKINYAPAAVLKTERQFVDSRAEEEAPEEKKRRRRKKKMLMMKFRSR